MAAALAVSTREIIMAMFRRNIAMIAMSATLSPFIVNYIAIIAVIAIIAFIAIIGTIAIIAYSPERPFRSDIRQKPHLKRSVCTYWSVVSGTPKHHSPGRVVPLSRARPAHEEQVLVLSGFEGPF